MAAAVVLFTYIGIYLDKLKWTEFPLFTLLGALFGVFAAMYYLIKKL